MSRTLLTADDYKAAFADRTKAAAIKAECERIWNCANPEYFGNRTIWQSFDKETGRMTCESGATCQTSMGATYAANMREMRKDYWPAISESESGRPRCPKWLRERFRRECPRNAAALIAGYGKIDSLSLRGEVYMQALQAPSLPGLMSAEIAREAAPAAPIAAPAIDPAAMSGEALDAAAAPILADVARELAEYVANVRADLEADAAREAAETAPEPAAPAPGPIMPPEPAKPASDRRRPRARRSRDMAPPTIWQARALGLADPVKKPRPARASWSR